MAKHDLIIRGGSVVDGTGAPTRTADVAISDGVVTHVGDVDGDATRVVDVDGALVTPGFVDVHTHYDGQATWDTHMQPSSWHGVTTAVFGNCGVGFAPVHTNDHNRLVELMEGVEDIPGAALHEGLSWNWNSLGEYLDALEGAKDMDIAAQVPHGAVRLHVMGERATVDHDATAEEIAEMGRLAVEGIKAGALGFTTSRTQNHRASTGEYTPTLRAARDELVGIAEALGVLGAGVLQVVSDFTDMDDEFETLRQMMERSGRPLSFSLVESPRGYEWHRRLLSKMEEARGDGLVVTGQTAVRPIGVLMGLECTLNPFMRNSVYREIADRPLAERVRHLRDPEFRRRLLTEADTSTEKSGKVGGRLIELFNLMYQLGDPPNYEPPTSAKVESIAAERGVSAPEAALDIMLADDGYGMLWSPFSNYGQGNLDGTRELLTHPYTVPGLSDGGAHVGTICDGSFPTTLLQHWGRDRGDAGIDIEFLVQRQCRDTARIVGLDDRGVLAPGYKADVNVIDLDRLQARRPELAYDLPAGGRRLLQRADGYAHTFVSGVETYAEGEATGALPGGLVRGAQPSPA